MAQELSTLDNLVSKLKDLNSKCDSLDETILSAQFDKLRFKHKIGKMLFDVKESLKHGDFGKTLSKISEESKHSESDYGHCLRLYSQFNDFREFQNAMIGTIREQSEASWYFVHQNILYDKNPTMSRNIETTMEKVQRRYEERDVINIIPERIWLHDHLLAYLKREKITISDYYFHLSVYDLIQKKEITEKEVVEKIPSMKSEFEDSGIKKFVY